VEFAFVILDCYVVDACLSALHLSFVVKRPAFIAIGPKPLTVCIVVLVLEAHSDPFFGEAPKRFGEAVVEFSLCNSKRRSIASELFNLWMFSRVLNDVLPIPGFHPS